MGHLSVQQRQLCRSPQCRLCLATTSPEQALIAPESVRVTDDSVFTAADWNNVLKGYSSQYVEHDYWVDESMIEGDLLDSPGILFGSS